MASCPSLIARTLLSATAFAVLAETADAETLLVTHRLPAALAFEAVGEAVAACAREDIHVSAVVVDNDAVEIASLRGDGAGVHTLGTARAKALAAVSLAAPVLNLETTGELAELAQQNGFRCRRACSSARAGSS